MQILQPRATRLLMELHPVGNPVKEAPVVDRPGEQAVVVVF
jgi:hypothetical protein